MSLLEIACFIRVKKKNGAELMLSRRLPISKISIHRPGLLSSFFSLIESKNFGISEPASSNRKTKQRFENVPNPVIYVPITWTKTKILKEKWIVRGKSVERWKRLYFSNEKGKALLHFLISKLLFLKHSREVTINARPRWRTIMKREYQRRI